MPAATESLAKRAGLFGEELAQYQSQLTAPAVPGISEPSGLPFVGFNDKKSAKYDDARTAGVGEGQPYLYANGKYTPLSSFEYHLLAATQLWVKYDATGKVIEGVTDTDPRSWTGPFKENIETAVLVYTPGGIVAARCGFRTTKCGAVRTAARELAQAGTPEWAAQSKEHTAAAKALAMPGTRFFVRVEINKTTAKGSGFAQYVAKGTPVITSPGKAKELQEWFGIPENRSALAQVLGACEQRVKELRSKIGGAK